MNNLRTRALTRAVIATVVFVAKKRIEHFFFHMLLVFLENYFHTADTEELYLELGDSKRFEGGGTIPETSEI